MKVAKHLLTNEIVNNKNTKIFHIIKVAIKILEKSKMTDPDDAKRVSREIKILKTISHPNIIRLH